MKPYSKLDIVRSQINRAMAYLERGELGSACDEVESAMELSCEAYGEMLREFEAKLEADRQDVKSAEAGSQTAERESLDLQLDLERDAERYRTLRSILRGREHASHDSMTPAGRALRALDEDGQAHEFATLSVEEIDAAVDAARETSHE